MNTHTLTQNEIESESEDETFLNNLVELNREHPTVKYIIDIATKEEDGYKETTHEEFDDMDLTRTTFNEALLNLNTKECRPFLDCDGFLPGKKSHEKHPDEHIKTIGEYNKFIEWVEESCLKKLETSEYAIVGYTKDEQLAEKTGLRLNKQNNHFVSAHLHFPKVKVNCKDWVAWLKEEKRTGKCPFIDLDVYHDKRQIFRCGLCNKQTCGKIEQSRGQVVANYEGFKQSDLLITPKGDEQTIQIEKVEQKPEQQHDDSLPDELVDSADILILTNDELLELFNCFEPRVQTGLEPHVCVSLKAPACYDVDDKLLNAILQWYNQVEHENGDKPVYDHFHQYREAEESNRWLFGLINHIEDESKREMFKTKYLKMMNKVKDEKVIEQNKPENVAVKYVELADIWRCETLNEKIDLLKQGIRFGYVQKAYYSRVGTEKIDLLKYEELKRLLSTYRITKSKDKELVMNELSQNVLMTTIETEFTTLFNGWHWLPVKSNKFNGNIQEFRNIFIENTFNNNVEVFEYYLKRMNFILHHPGELSKIMFWFVGLMGTGKNTFTDLMAEIFKNYSNPNLNLSKTTQKHNTITYGMTYGVFNEVVDSDLMTNIAHITEELKKLIDSKTTDFEPKGVNPFTAKNTMNYDATSNNMKPLILSVDDRRHVIVQTSNKHANDKTFWGRYYNEILCDEFVNDVFTYIYMFNPSDDFLSLPLPMTQMKRTIQQMSMNDITRFITDNLESFIKGVSQKDLKQMVMLNRGKYSEVRFTQEVMKYLVEREDKHRKMKFYMLSDNWIDKFEQLGEDVEEEEEEVVEPDDEVEKLKEDFDDWIINNRVETDSFWYLLMKDINEFDDRQRLIEHLESEGWSFRKTISKAITKRGYKLMKQ